MNDSLFSKIWIQKMCCNVRSKHYYHRNKTTKLTRQKPRHPTWSICLERNMCKLNKRKKRQSGLKRTTLERSLWNKCYSNQREKLRENYDLNKLWLKTEYRILNKINKNCFPRNQAPDVLWKYIVSKEVTKINQMRRGRKNRERTQERWDYVCTLFRSRMISCYNRNFMGITDWEYCLKANLNRINNKKD